MDIATLARDLTAFLAPFLPYLLRAGEKAAEEAGKRLGGDAWDWARQFWSRLHPKIKARPAAQEAAQDAAASPQDEDALAALRQQLKKLLAEDPALADDLSRLWERARAAGVTVMAIGDRSVAGRDFYENIIITGTGTVYYQAPPPPTPPSAKNTLPAQPFFVGRERELAIIADALSPGARTWGVLIDGPGGIGKTALALRAAHLAPDDLFEYKFFITAKVRELTPAGEASLKDFTRPTYLAMLDELAQSLGVPDFSRLPPEERPRALQRALSGKRALIVLDNLETLPEEERVRLFQFLNHLPPGNKAIVTSRRRTDVDARILRLDRLSRAEAEALLDKLAQDHPLLQRATPQERDALYTQTGGNPLLIIWVVGQLGRSGSRCRTLPEAIAFLNQAPPGNDPLEYIFGDLLETFTQEETFVLAALTHFTGPARLKWIADMTGLPERAAETALEDLTDRSVLTSDPEARAWLLPPLTAHFIRTRRPEAVARTGDALTARAYALAMQYGGESRDYEKFPTLDAEWDLIAAALPRFLQGDNARLQAVCDKLARFLDFTGRWDDRLWLSERAEARALEAGDWESAGWRAYQAGWVYSLRGQADQVLACADRAADHWRESTPRNRAVAIRLRGLGYRLKKDYPAAIAAYREALDIDRAINPESRDVAIDLNALAGAEHLSGDYDAAERDYREALRIARKIRDDEGVAIYTGNLADPALDRQRWAEAESLAREALTLAEQVGRQELIASDCHRIARALLRQNRDLEEARALARRAVEIYARLRHPDLQAAQETLAEVERALGAQ